MFKIVFNTGEVFYTANHLDAVLAMANAEDAVVWKQQNDGWKFVVATTNAFKKGMVV